MTKQEKTAARNAVKALLATAASIGFDIAGGFERAVALISAIKGNKVQMEKAQSDYVRGYVARSLQRVHADRLGNAAQSALLTEAAKVIGKASPDSKKGDDEKRTVEEHKAVRAASTSWATAKRQAGIAPTKAGGRKPRPSSNDGDAPKAPPVDLVKASPKLESPVAANDYFAVAAAALLATVNKNAADIDCRIRSAVEDFHAAVKAVTGSDDSAE